MKSTKNLLEQLKPLPHISKTTVLQLGRQLGLSESSVDTYISRFGQRKELYRLKNGLYVSADFYAANRGDISYAFYLANILRPPSYVSSWAALQYYNLTTEAIHSITSVTPKVTREYLTRVGSFSYQSIHPALFSDFVLVRKAFDFYLATPSKALFDLLYFRTSQFRGLSATVRKSKKKMKDLVVDLRIDFDEMDKKEQEKFYSLMAHYE